LLEKGHRAIADEQPAARARTLAELRAALAQ
jgi:hypothetical protein